MALKISKNSALTDIVSSGVLPYLDSGGNPTATPSTTTTTNPAYNPIKTSHPTTGSSQQIQVWLFNDDATKYYTGISVDPIDTTGTDESGYIELAPDNAGSPGTFLAASAALSMADIGQTGTGDTSGHPFWLKVTTPSGLSTQNKTDIQLNVIGQEFAV